MKKFSKNIKYITLGLTLLFISFAFSHSAQANQYVYNCILDGDIISDVSISANVFPQNNPTTFTASGQISSTCPPTLVNLKVQNNNNPQITLVADTTINPGLPIPFSPASTTFTSPSPSGSYIVTFTTGIEESMGGGGGGGGGGPAAYYVCFVADTKVSMADGTVKNIQDVKIGDVLKGATSNNTVLAFHRPLESDGKIFGFNGGRLFVTEEHPFKTTQGWKSLNPDKTRQENIGIAVTALEVGDTLITESGTETIESIESKEVPSTTPLYNFMLSGDRTYYADGYLVHNKAQCDKNSTFCIDNATHLLVPPESMPSGTQANSCAPVGDVYQYNNPAVWIGGCGGYYMYRGCYGGPDLVACGDTPPQ